MIVTLKGHRSAWKCRYHVVECWISPRLWFSQERGQSFEDVHREIIIMVGCGMYSGYRG